MARIMLRQLLDHAAEHGYGVPAFNINNMEQGLAIMEAAAAVDAPVIIQASRGARSYANDIMLARMIDALEEMYPQIPLCLHQDHGNEEATCATAIKHGFTSVMMDGSLKADGKTPAAYSYNVEPVRRRDAAGLVPARRRDRARHQARRAQSKYRYRLPPGNDGRFPQGGRTSEKRVRPAEISQARDGRDARPLPRAVRAVRDRR